MSLLLLCALLAITLYVYSPYHWHDRFSRQQCDFAQFEHGPNLLCGKAIFILPTFGSILLPHQRPEIASEFFRNPVRSGRSPPAGA